MPYDATKLADWQISEEAEKHMPTPEEWRERLGLQKDEMLPMGRLSKIDFLKIVWFSNIFIAFRFSGAGIKTKNYHL